MSRLERSPRAKVVVRPQEYDIEWTEIDLMVDGEKRKEWTVNKWLTKGGYERRVGRKTRKAERQADRINNPHVMSAEEAAALVRDGMPH